MQKILVCESVKDLWGKKKKITDMKQGNQSVGQQYNKMEKGIG